MVDEREGGKKEGAKAGQEREVERDRRQASKHARVMKCPPFLQSDTLNPRLTLQHADTLSLDEHTAKTPRGLVDEPSAA